MPRASFSLQFPQGLRLWYFDCKIAAAIFFHQAQCPTYSGNHRQIPAEAHGN